MFIVAAVLPFLPLIEDAMILKMQDSDARKRAQAAVFLHNVMRESCILHSGALLIKITSAREEKSKEVRAKDRNKATTDEDRAILDGLGALTVNNGELYGVMRFYRRVRFQFIYIFVLDKTIRSTDKEAWGRLAEMLGPVVYKTERWGVSRLGDSGSQWGQCMIIFPVRTALSAIFL
jgi:hypothetical protein